MFNHLYMTLSKKNYALILLSLVFSLTLSAQQGGNDLIISVSSNDMGYKVQLAMGIDSFFNNNVPLPDAVVHANGCGVMSLVHNVAVTNTGPWSQYDTFKTRIFVKSTSHSFNLNLFTDSSTAYEPYIETALMQMTHCSTPSSCGYSGNFYTLNGATPSFGFYNSTQQEFLTCASAGVWEVDSATSSTSQVYSHPISNSKVMSAITSASASMQTFYANTAYFYALATHAVQEIAMKIEIYGGVQSGSNPVTWSLLATEDHANPIALSRGSTTPYTLYEVASIYYGTTPPNLDSMQACASPINRLASEKANLLDVSLSPNPVRDQLTVTIEDDQTATPFEIAIYDLQGTAILHEEALGQDGFVEKTVTTAQLAKGYYMLKVTSRSGTQIQKFVKI